MLRVTVLVVLLAFVVSGCATIEENPKTAIGGFGGAAFGGLIAAAAGASPAGIAAATIGGALLGGMAGNYLDQRDKQMAMQANRQALETAPSGQSVPWRNPDSGHSGSVTPTRTYQNASGQYCREFQQTVTIDNKPENSYGTACRQPDGSWRTTN